MAKKKEEKIVEEVKEITKPTEEEKIVEEVIIENSDGDVKTEESSVEAPAEEEIVKLKIEIDLTDKYDKVTSYKVGDVVSFKSKRADELLRDPRKLVSKV